ncbi:hypothetical protein [Mesorhizobium sp.]|uniref:hypothetical protein n=1 Tax=Mesorhizobium sp. TaxID=1871066 RepID=UPI00257AD834|nr:hypothetical protein [Mesorhizobium sp.]
MTLAWYPPELPRPERAPYQVSRGDGRTRRAEDAGPPNVRRRFSAVATTVAFSTILTRAQLARFDRFFDEEIKQGTLPFLMPAPDTHGLPLLTEDGTPLLTDGGVPILIAETWLCLIGQQMPARAPSSPGSIQWRVSFDIAVMP